MKPVTHRPGFQGEIMIRRIDALPANAAPAAKEPGPHMILAHSETGHHHVIENGAAERFIDQTNEFITYVRMLSPGELRHLRDWDTHETLTLEIGRAHV